MSNIYSIHQKPAEEEPLIPVSSTGPYPVIEVERENPRYAMMLMQDMASQKGEMTSIYQYLYEHWVLEEIYQKISELLKRIAAVEMRHLDILGKLILLLGGDPKCQADPRNRNTEWQGNMISYRNKLAPLISRNIMLEEAAIHTYTSQAEYVKDQKLSAVLFRMAEDEKLHLHIFKELFSQLPEHCA